MKGKEALIKAVETYVTDTAETLFGLPRMASATIVKALIKNNFEKYEPIIDLFIDKEGNIINEDDLFNAFKEILNEKPLQVWKVKFSGNDIDELQTIFKQKMNK